MDVLDSLSISQKEILASFQSITNQDNIETSVEVLNGTAWDLETAISNLYDRPAGSSSGTSTSYPPTTSEESSSSRPLLDQFGIDDSVHDGRSPGRRMGHPQTEPLHWLKKILSLPLSIVAWPVGFLYSAAGLFLSFVARILHVRPGVSGLRPRNPFARDPNARAIQKLRLDPKASAERWIRSVEELTGSIRWSKRDQLNESGDSGVGTRGSNGPRVASGSSSQGLRRRRDVARTIPDFFEGSYDDAVRTIRQTFRVLMVVLTSEEHEDDETFKKLVLTDPDLSLLLRTEDVLCWGGDVKDRDAYLVSKTLRPFRYPFITFVSLQPPPSSTSRTSSTSTVAVISRLEGPPQTSTSASTITAHLNNAVLPRVTPYLTRLRSQAATRFAERQLREEQDRAFARAAAQDTERVLARRKLEEEKRLNAISSARQSEEFQRKEEQQKVLRERASAWRTWRRSQLAKLETPDDKEVGAARIVVTLGDGRRVMRKFRSSDTVETIYAFVECAIDSHDEERSDASGKGSSKPDGYEHIYEFRLATTFPRQVLEIDGTGGDRTVAEVGFLSPSGNLVAEGLEKRRKSLGLESRSNVNSDDDEEEEEA